MNIAKMDGDQQRTMQGLQGLLQFCIEATKSEDATGTPGTSALSDEDKQFINNALAAAMGKDPVKLMMDDLNVLTKQESTNEDKEEALENLQMHCEDLDLARDLHKIGGYEVVEKLLHDDSAELRWRAADLLATTVQNNPYCQEAALRQGLMQVVLQTLDKDPADTVRVKAMLAVSGITRGFPPAEDVLLAEDGLSVLTRTLQSKNDKLETKVCFFISFLFETAPRFKELFCSVGIVEQLVSILHSEYKPHHEHVLRALATLVKDNPTAVTECRRPELNLKHILTQKIQILKNGEANRDALHFSEEILSTCFTGNSADR